MSDKARTPKRKPTSSKPASKNEFSANSERDLPLKLKMRRLFWSMGSSTCLDVKLRAYVSGDERGTSRQEYTDLDVLGVACSIDGRLQFALADCKTSSRRAIERMFWIRGVADFFEADNAYLVRSNTVPAATRSLSVRLGIGVLDPHDFEKLLETFETPLSFSGPLECLFDARSVQRQLSFVTDVDKKLKPLIDYMRFDYWVYEPYRNLTQVVAHLAESVKTLDPQNPLHQSLFFEAAWLYSLAVAQASHHVRISRMSDILTAVRTYVAGGELALREKNALAKLLEQAGIVVDTRSAVLPPYTDDLAELITRITVRPSEASDILRYAEYLSTATAVGEGASVGVAFGQTHVRPIAAKLLADVCGFLVAASGLRPDFRMVARHRLVHDLTGGDVKETQDDDYRSAGASPTTASNDEEKQKASDSLELPFGGETETEIVD
ncbi:MAG: hypothetical protein F4Z06_12970 [Acidimicrobiia bacterium]|nr:hypothetical protein [Acidimicrobiia bacterium]MYE72743.1 hypothetical protein [Acidimicrobiia bacterium]MYJ61888.1 hypothetical protein [Acidimicrobiia bacterium]